MNGWASPMSNKLAPRQTPFFRQELQQRIVGAVFRRRRGDPDLEHGGAVGQMRNPIETIDSGAWRQPDGDAHAARRRRDREVRGGSRG